MSDAGAEPVAPAVPRYLYHATTRAVAELIATSALVPLSRGGEDGALYISASSALAGARTLNGRASDVVLRIDTSGNPAVWYERGAGHNEWRSHTQVEIGDIMYRRFIRGGTNPATSQTWRQLTNPYVDLG